MFTIQPPPFTTTPLQSRYAPFYHDMTFSCRDSPPISPPQDGLQDRNPVRSFLDDPRRRGPAQDERHGGSRRHGRNWGGTDFEGVRAGLEQRVSPPRGFTGQKKVRFGVFKDFLVSF